MYSSGLAMLLLTVMQCCGILVETYYKRENDISSATLNISADNISIIYWTLWYTDQSALVTCTTANM